MSVLKQPDCSIDLEDLRIDAHDRTSISGEGIKPGVRMKVNEGDMLILGKSDRFYRPNWIPLSCSYDTINKETEEAMDQEENSFFCSNDQMNTLCLSMQKVSSTVPLKPEENQFPQTCGGSLKKQLPVLNATAFCPLPVNFIGYHRAERKPESEEKFWIIVVDTQCLLNKMSMRELKLMRGLRRTRLLIPQIVIRELDCMLKRGSFFRRTAEVSAALKWIEESMSVSNWWINVETSSEESNNRLFALYASITLQEIVTPTAADLILGYALFFRSTQNKDGQLVILSDDVTLKIKAMAEGAKCEAAQYFRESLVNPFSDRFLYSESSPVGPHPFHIDAAVHLHGYYPKPSKRLSESFQIAAGLAHI